jgi:hypothetical protein
MYNTTVSFAVNYTQSLTTGFSATDGTTTFHVQVPLDKIILGYPASFNASGAGSVFLAPSEVAALLTHVKCGGVMAWSVGWDQRNNWAFANALAPVVTPAVPPPPLTVDGGVSVGQVGGLLVGGLLVGVMVAGFVAARRRGYPFPFSKGWGGGSTSAHTLDPFSVPLLTSDGCQPAGTKLTAGWYEYCDDEGTPYYFHPHTETTQWEKPMW